MQEKGGNKDTCTHGNTKGQWEKGCKRLHCKYMNAVLRLAAIGRICIGGETLVLDTKHKDGYMHWLVVAIILNWIQKKQCYQTNHFTEEREETKNKKNFTRNSKYDL